MRLDVVGAGPAWSDRPGASGAAYLLRVRASSLLLDLGQGSFPRLAGLVEPSSLDGIAISHLHPDHLIDLVPLRHYLRWGFVPARRVRVIGPAALAERLDALHDEPGFASAALDLEPLTPGQRQVGDFIMEARQVTHARDSWAFRVTAGRDRGLVYSGDCGRAADLDPLIRPGDDLLCEISFGIGPIPPGAMHLDATEVGALAVRTKPARVLLTHIQTGFDRAAAVDAVKSIFRGPVDMVEPGNRFDLD